MEKNNQEELLIKNIINDLEYISSDKFNPETVCKNNGVFIEVITNHNKNVDNGQNNKK